MSEFRLLILADIHYDPRHHDPDEKHPGRRTDVALEWVRRAVEDALRRGPVHAVVILGDLIDHGKRLRRNQGPAAYAGALAAVRRTLSRAAPQAELLAIPGNHDGDADEFYTALGLRGGLHDVGPVRVLAIADHFAGKPKHVTRADADRQAVLDAGLRTPRRPLIVLQHNPMDPPVDGDHPYMLTNRPDVMSDYARAGVTLSLSGHYHAGQPLHSVGGVRYFTCPALCERPFSYAVATLDTASSPPAVRVQTHPLELDGSLDIWDGHAHTEFAFCGEGTSAASAVARAADVGLAGVCLVEHAPQLYVSKEDFWSGRHVYEAGSWRRGANRMAAYRQAVLPLRSRRVKVGLEVELDAAGDLTLLDEDRWWPDVMVGAVHFLHPDTATLSDAAVTKRFLDTTEKLLASGVDVLAHPLRLFAWSKRTAPTDIYPRLVNWLAATGTAAEINYHHNAPDVEFFRQCIHAGVKIALGSDAHSLHAVGNFGRHVALLQEAAGEEDVARLLWRP